MSDLAAIPFQFMTSYGNMASVGIEVVDELHNFDLEKSGKSSRSHRAVRSRTIRGKWTRIDRNLPRKMHGGQAPKARKSHPCIVKTMH